MFVNQLIVHLLELCSLAREFIDKTRHLRKAVGVGMRQAGAIAACVLISLKEMALPERLLKDHFHAKKLAERMTTYLQTIYIHEQLLG